MHTVNSNTPLDDLRGRLTLRAVYLLTSAKAVYCRLMPERHRPLVRDGIFTAANCFPVALRYYENDALSAAHQPRPVPVNHQ